MVRILYVFIPMLFLTYNECMKDVLPSIIMLLTHIAY